MSLDLIAWGFLGFVWAGLWFCIATVWQEARR